MSFNIALSGINAINTELNTISNNIANASTYGFKSSRANFAAMYAGTQSMGTEVSSLTQSIDIGGSVLTTGRNLDASLQGRGFFVTRDISGAEVYTRVGIFSVDKDGYLSDSFGRRVQGYAALENSTALGAVR
jgi:flagellar hook protein FlgE